MHGRKDLFDENDSPEFRAKLLEVHHELGGSVTASDALNLGKDVKARQELARNLPEAPGFADFWTPFNKEEIKKAWTESLRGFDTQDPKGAAEYINLNALVKRLDPDLYFQIYTDDVNLRPKAMQYAHTLQNYQENSHFLKYAEALEVLRPKEDPEDFAITQPEWERLTGYISMLFEHSNFREFARLYSQAAFLNLAEINRRLKITDKKWEVLQNIFKAQSPDDVALKTSMSMHLRAMRPKDKRELFVTSKEWQAKCKTAEDAYKYTLGKHSSQELKTAWLQTFLQRSIETKYANVAQDKQKN